MKTYVAYDVYRPGTQILAPTAFVEYPKEN